MNNKKRIVLIALTALLTIGSAVNVFAEGNDTPKDDTGKLYAGQNGSADNYVSEDILSVAFQATPLNADGTEPETASLRMVTTVNDLSYEKVGFVIWVTGEKTWDEPKTVEIDKVYKKITVAEGSSNPDYDKTPKAFCEDSEYFATHTVTGISKEYYRNTYFTVTPYWITEDNVTVYGVTRSVMLGDVYDGIINVPVRLNSDIKTAAGSVEVTYPADIMTYEGYYNSGAVYQEMTVNGETSGTVKCVGNVTDITDNVDADGMYVSLRFKVTRESDGSLPEADVSVNKNMFCDNVEEIVTVPVVQAKYYTFNEPVEE